MQSDADGAVFCVQCGRGATMTYHGMCADCMADSMDDFEEQDDDPDAEFLEFDCGMMPDGFCMLAGTEECDWECPRTRSLFTPTDGATHD